MDFTGRTHKVYELVRADDADAKRRNLVQYAIDFSLYRDREPLFEFDAEHDDEELDAWIRQTGDPGPNPDSDNLRDHMYLIAGGYALRPRFIQAGWEYMSVREMVMNNPEGWK